MKEIAHTNHFPNLQEAQVTNGQVQVQDRPTSFSSSKGFRGDGSCCKAWGPQLPVKPGGQSGNMPSYPSWHPGDHPTSTAGEVMFGGSISRMISLLSWIWSVSDWYFAIWRGSLLLAVISTQYDILIINNKTTIIYPVVSYYYIYIYIIIYSHYCSIHYD